MSSGRKKTEENAETCIALLDPDRQYLVDNIFHQELTEDRKTQLSEAKRYHAQYLSDAKKKEFWEFFGVTDGQDWNVIKDTIRGVHLAYIREHSLDEFTRSQRIPNEHLARIFDAISTQKIFEEVSVRPKPFDAYAYWLLLNHLEGIRKTKPSKSRE
ncbi:hypothetical protein TWF506_004386 [Arthrobotrys conoides]|uniref:Uncharacterized protein n=1 Tax=Arthrobotrys conoides TaxID=74498 RepID=A0AAN8NA89_9PEZI